MQLGRDAQGELHVERVVVRDERPRRGATGHARAAPASRPRRSRGRRGTRRMAAIDREADLEDAARVVVGDEVDVALAEARVDVGEAVPLVGQRPQRLREQLERVHLHGELALLRLHHRAVGADPVAEVEVVEAPRGARRRARRADTNSWSAPVPSRSVANDELALPAQRADAARDAHRRRRSRRRPRGASQCSCTSAACACGRSGPGTGRWPCVRSASTFAEASRVARRRLTGSARR